MEIRKDYDPKSINPTSIAMFIAAGLRHPIPRSNSRVGWSSTIKIDQYKSKFGSVIVYARLAYPELVDELWALRGHEDQCTQEFKKQCLKQDIRHYRSVHLEMFKVLNADVVLDIKKNASYPELLCADEHELDTSISNLNDARTLHLLSFYDCADLTSLKTFITKVCFEK